MASQTIRALVMPAGNEPAYLIQVEPDLSTMQSLVGGLLQALPIGSGGTMYLNEEGKYAQLPVNRQANVLARKLDVGLAADDFIVGQAVVVGQLDDQGRADGNDHDVPESILGFCRELGMSIEDRTHPTSRA